jgi:teichuronic acid biosynthesis glycosyltransferase TuaC
MKIAVVTPYFPTSTRLYNGHSAFHTLRYLKRQAEIEVFCPITHYPRWLTPKLYKGSPDLTYQPPELKTTYFQYPAIPVVTRPVNGLTCARILLPYVRAMRPDLILNYWLYPEGFSAVRVGETLGVPVVVGAIGSDLRARNDPWTRRFVRRTMELASGVIAVSEELRQVALAWGIPPEKVITILNGCDTAIFHPGAHDAARREVGCEDQGELLLYVGNLIASKGLGELIAAFCELLQSRPRARLAVIGQGPYGDTLAERAASAGASGRLLMLGRQDSAGVARWMRAADLFCLPSYSEGCPNAVVEALACGRPVVATAVGGVPELVQEGCGILIPPRDPARLREALDTALSNTWDTAHIAAAHRRSWEEVARRTFEVCRGALDAN